MIGPMVTIIVNGNKSTDFIPNTYQFIQTRDSPVSGHTDSEETMSKD